METQSKPKIIYVFDVLCGWCYGFTDTLTTIYNEYHEIVDFEFIPGGLYAGAKAGLIQTALPENVLSTFDAIHSRANVSFGQKFLEHYFANDIQFDSDFADAAFLAFQQLSHEHHLEYLSAIQQAIFATGHDPMLTATYSSIAQEYGVDSQTFVQHMKSAHTSDQLRSTFAKAKSLGASAYPTILVAIDGEAFIVSEGLLHLNDIRTQIDKLLDDDLVVYL